MNISKLKYCILLWCLGVQLSCSDPEETSRIISLEPFESIELNGVFSVYLEESSQHSITISGYGDTPDYVKAIVQDNKLIITDHSENKWLHPKENAIKLHVSASQFKGIMANATCYFETITPITGDSFSLIMGAATKVMEGRLELNTSYMHFWGSHLCGGKLTLTGNVDQLNLNPFATMAVDARNLICKSAYVNNSSKSDCELYVTDVFTYSIHGSGNIYLSGNPLQIVLSEKTSTGRLILR
jgi:hypothetical protein